MRLNRSLLIASALAALLARPGIPEDKPVPTPLVEQTRSDLVLIEVYARDSKGRVVRDLRPDELVLKVDQNKAPRKIENFEFIEPESEGTVPAEAIAEGEDAPLVQDPSTLNAGQARRQRPRRFMLFFDDDTSNPNNMAEARRAALRFLQGSGLATDQFSVTVYEQARKLEVLCPFTDDRGEITRALEASLADPGRMSDYASERVARREEIQRLGGVGGNPVVTQPGAAAGMPRAAVPSSAASETGQDPRVLARQYAQEDSQRMGRLLNNIRTLVEGLAAWDGYKAIVFFGDGVPENPAMDYGMNDPRRALTEELSHLAFSAGSSNVVLHTVQTTGVVAGRPNEVASGFRRSNALSMLALDTGGIMRATNDLKGALDDIEVATHGYYLLSYLPIEPPDGTRHSISVKCKRNGVTLRHRQYFTRFTPEESRTRSVQAAYQVPEINDGLGVELSLIAGPVAGPERVVDVVVYMPAGRLLYLPQPGGAAATVEVGFVALDAGGRETMRLSRRVQLGVDAYRALHGGSLSYNFYSRVKLPLGAQTLTAVISDLHSGDLGAARVLLEAAGQPPPAVHGRSLYAVGEKSLWVQVEAARNAAAAAAAPAAFTIGPTLRSRFFAGEKVSCGFKGEPSSGGSGPMRVEVRRGERVVRSIEVPAGGAEAGATEPQSPSRGLDLPTQGLETGEYVLSVAVDRAGGPVEIGRLPFRIAARR